MPTLVVRGLAAVVFLLVAVFDSVVVSKEGIWSLVPPFATLHEYQLFLDLSVGLGLCAIAMVVDARQQGRPLIGWLFLVGTILFGSLAPLAYLVIRPSAKPAG